MAENEIDKRKREWRDIGLKIGLNYNKSSSSSKIKKI